MWGVKSHVGVGVTCVGLLSHVGSITCGICVTCGACAVWGTQVRTKHKKLASRAMLAGGYTRGERRPRRGHNRGASLEHPTGNPPRHSHPGSHCARPQRSHRQACTPERSSCLATLATCTRWLCRSFRERNFRERNFRERNFRERNSRESRLMYPLWEYYQTRRRAA